MLKYSVLQLKMNLFGVIEKNYWRLYLENTDTFLKALKSSLTTIWRAQKTSARTIW